MEAAKYLCLALDQPGCLTHQILAVRQFRGLVDIIKVHFTFLKLHSDLVEALLYMGFKVWLDLKFHDTPETVREEIMVLKEMGVSFATIDLFGGSEMVQKVVAAANNLFPGSQRPLILGTTILTSIDKKMMNEELRVPGEVFDQVLHLTHLGRNNGVAGVVCSGLEAKAVRGACGPDFFIATTGIRFSGSNPGSHKRIATPREAIRNGSNLVVMGGELIRGGPEAAERALFEIEKGFKERTG